MSLSIHPGSISDTSRCVDLWTRVIVARDGSDVAAEVARRARAAFTEPNARAIALYERAGFSAVSDPWDYDGGDRVVTWSLDLTIAKHSR